MAVACVGDNVVDIYAAMGAMFPGGNAVNVAVAARRAGSRAAYIGCVGTDQAGMVVRDALSCEGIELERLRVAEGTNAFATVQLVDGDRVFLEGDMGVSRAVIDTDDLRYLYDFDVVHTGDNSGLEDHVEVLARSTDVSFDFGGRDESYWLALARHVRIACFSRADGSPQDSAELARAVLAAGPEMVVITHGHRGASVFDTAGNTYLPAAEVEILDTLGAGDSLIGTFLAAVTRGVEPARALADGIRAAAVTCQTYGAFGYGVAAVGVGAQHVRPQETRR